MSSPPILTVASLNSLKVLELKKELRDRGIVLPGAPKKSDLIARLTELLTVDPVSSAAAPSEDLLSQAIQGLEPPKPSAAVSMSPAKTVPATKVVTSVSAPTSATVSATAAVAKKEAAGPTCPPIADGQKPLIAVKSPGPKTDILAARAARFGSSVSAPAAAAAPVTESLEALKKRSERFGVAVSPAVATLETEAKKAQRANRFNLSLDELAASEGGKGIKLGLKRKGVTAPVVAKKRVMTAEQEATLKKRQERFGVTA